MKKILKIASLAIILISILLFVSPAKAEVYYVASNGSDNNAGTILSPFATITYGARLLQPGDTLYIRAGTYHQAASIWSSGSSSAPITIAGYPGEKIIIDGQYTIPGPPNSANWYSVLVNINGSYVTVQNITVQQSWGMGLAVYGNHDIIDNVISQLNMENGILASFSADYSVVENSQAYSNAMSNVNGSRGRDGSWASGISSARSPNHVILRNNIVWDTWGEGMSTYGAEYTTIENNIIYDSYSANLYLNDTKFSSALNNLIYCTPGNPLDVGPQEGIEMGDETYDPASSDNSVINNLVMGCKRNFDWWIGLQGGGLVNSLIAYNTFVNGTTADIRIQVGAHSGSKFENNIILQEGSLTMVDPYLANNGGVVFSNNLWSKTPPSLAAGEGDIIADPLLMKTGNTGPGQLSPYWFNIAANSPARNKALAMAQVTQDYFGNSRESTADIGACQYTSNMPYTLTASATGNGFGQIFGTSNTSSNLINCGVNLPPPVNNCSTTVMANTAVTLTATAASGSTFTGWTGGDCSGTNSCSLTMNANANVTANFDPQNVIAMSQSTITVIAGAGGAISPSGAMSVSNGASQAFTVTPNAGYIGHLTVDNATVMMSNNTYTLSNITRAHTIAVSFSLQTKTIAVSAGPGGMISPAGAVNVNYGADQIFTINPNGGYTASLTVDGATVGLTNNTYTLSNVTSAHKVIASFTSAVQVQTAVNGLCGAASQIYPFGTTGFTGTLCAAGSPNPLSVVFPAAGSTVNWTCQGTNGGSNASCSASLKPKSIFRFTRAIRF